MPGVANFDLEINQSDFDYFLLREIRSVLEKTINRNINKVKLDIQRAVYDRLLKSNFYKQFTSGQMYYEIGNRRAAVDLKAIFKIISDNLLVSLPIGFVGNGQLAINIELGILESSYNDILTSSFASYTSINSQGKRTLIEWMKWLLVGGSGPLIINYEFYTAPNVAQWSRTGQSIMIKSKNNWGLRSVWAGVQGDNVLTRELQGIELTFFRIVDLNIISKL